MWPAGRELLTEARARTRPSGLGECASEDDRCRGDDGDDGVLGSGCPFEVVVEEVVDDAGGEVEGDDEEGAGEDAIEREEVEREAKLGEGYADGDGDEKGAGAGEAALAEELECEEHADGADGEAREEKGIVAGEEDGVEGECDEVGGDGHDEAEGAVELGTNVDGLVFAESDDADAEGGEDGESGAGVAFDGVVDEEGGTEDGEGGEEGGDGGIEGAAGPGWVAPDDAVSAEGDEEGGEPREPWEFGADGDGGDEPGGGDEGEEHDAGERPAPGDGRGGCCCQGVTPRRTRALRGRRFRRRCATRAAPARLR